MLQRFGCRAFARRLIPENRRYQQHQYEPSFRNPKGFGDTVGNTSLRDNTRVSSADFMPASERVTATINAKIQKFKTWEAIVMSFKEEFAEAQRRFGLLGFYDKFEYVVILLLTALIAVFIVFALWNVALKIFLSIAASSFDPTDYVVFQAVFGMIFTVIIALEFKRSLLVVAERQHSVVQVRTVLLIALLAIVRKLLILDVGRGAEELFALAAAIIALGAVYWLVRDQDRSELRERRTVEEAERVSRLAGERDSTKAGNDS
jgi:uncharacterized membrane protein (DUF373 family)